MPETPLEQLERWEDFGATWRTLELDSEHVVLQLCTCYGEPVDRLESADPALIEYVRAASSSTR
jgi:hypothetical protein